MADGVSQKDPHVIAIELEDVIDVAGDVLRRPPQRRHAYTMELRQLVGQQLFLREGRELKLAVHLGHLVTEATMRDTGKADLASQVINLPLAVQHAVDPRADGLTVCLTIHDQDTGLLEDAADLR